MSSHSIVHIEIPATDRKVASQFYSDAFGWSIDNSMDAFNYTLFTAGDGPGGGFPDVTNGFEVGQVLIHISTNNIEESLKHIESLGGKTTLPKTEIPDNGWYAIFEDPSGNSIGLYQDKNAS